MDTRKDISTALLVMDLHPIFLGRIEKQQAETLINNLQQAIAAARKAGMLIIYVVLGSREGMPEISPDNRSFHTYKQSSPDFHRMLGASSIVPELAPQPGDLVVTKRRVSAFTGSDLEIVLRAHKVQHLVLSGISTSGVVLSTLREAADKDFRLTVLSDGCADPDPEAHTVLLSRVFPRQAGVLTSAEWAPSAASH
jgi:nicotinamidase-related amidase